MNKRYFLDTLFSCAILQSGSSISSQYYQPDPLKYAKKIGQKYNLKFNTSSDNMGKELKALLHNVSSSDLLKTSEEVSNFKHVNENLRFVLVIWLYYG